MECLKTVNATVNAVIFPGTFAKSSYTTDDFPAFGDEPDNLKLLFIPFRDPTVVFSGPKYIPALLHIAAFNRGSTFCIHFHGNSCDIGQISQCVLYEGYHYQSHYLAVEYPQFGITPGGYVCEQVLDAIARCVYNFVTNDLQVPPDRVVLIGRSIGTGPSCSLASHLESLERPPAALILHAPFTSLRDAAYDLLGCLSYLFLNRWENWKRLCKVKTSTAVVIKGKGKQDTPNITEYTVTASAEVTLNPLVVKQGSTRQDDKPHDVSANPAAAADIQKDSLSTNDVDVRVEDHEHDNYCNPSSAAVITCPVLFIHADNDLIIDVQHSRMMHELRCAAGLSSTYFEQKSVPGFKKGHNFYDYVEEVVKPTIEFLDRHVAPAPPVTLPLKRVREVCIVPEEVRMAQAQSSAAAVMSKACCCGNHNDNENEHEHEEEDQVGYAVDNRDFDYSRPNSPHARNRHNKLKSNERAEGAASACSGDSIGHNTPSVLKCFSNCITSCWNRRNCWLCPVSFCCEASIACSLTALTSAYNTLSGTTPAFRYITKQERGLPHMNALGVLAALGGNRSIVGLIREQPPDPSCSTSSSAADTAEGSPTERRATADSSAERTDGNVRLHDTASNHIRSRTNNSRNDNDSGDGSNNSVAQSQYRQRGAEGAVEVHNPIVQVMLGRTKDDYRQI